MVKVEIVAAILSRGIGLGKRPVSGVARIFKDPEAANRELKPGEILVTETTDAAWVPAMQKAGGILVQTSGLSSQTALVALEFGVPVILGIDHMDTIEDGEVVTLEPSRGIVFRGQVNL
jgi:pyruvate kinase